MPRVRRYWTVNSTRNKLVCVALLLGALRLFGATNAAILGWNNLGMHCMDSDYSVFSILPPYNTIEAQLVVGGKLVTNGAGYTVTYQALADPDGSINSTAIGKGNYAAFYQQLYTPATLPQDVGLLGWSMPGRTNLPQAMLFEKTNFPAPGVAASVNWFRAEGIPITPYDDAGRKNPYPLMRLIARNSANQPIATNDVVLPVSDEMDCRACHASGTQSAAQPAAGWVWNGLPERDYRLNILRLHDERQFANHRDLYTAALAARGFNAAGLYRGVLADRKPVLCAACHASEALGAPSYDSIPPLTASVHAFHAHVQDPVSNTPLDSAVNRSACYRCHPGSTTRCLRGAMGGAVAKDGSMEMQCQSCHGNMSQVGAANRVGWFMEPNCQSCHTGTAASNNGQIRYVSSFETNGAMRVATNLTFATQANQPAPGISLFRFSAGHGGLQCEACHGSTHAEFPSTHRNDNLRNLGAQGHAGMMIECTACHGTMNANATNAAAGPHGMHPLGQTWINNHPDLIGSGAVTRAQCQACHGTNYRGSVLGKAQTTRTVTSKFGTRTYWRGQQVGCYDCHDGANSSNSSTNAAPVVSNVFTNAANSAAVAVRLTGTDANGHALAFRIVTQPTNGTVGVASNVATYFPYPGFVGTDVFTFAANDGYTDSNLGTATVAVVQGDYSLGLTAQVPPVHPAGWPVAFAALPTVNNHSLAPSYAWDFGDATAPSTNQYATHAYALPGIYNWRVVASVAGVNATNAGTIQISSSVRLSANFTNGAVALSWPEPSADVLLEAASTLQSGGNWANVTNVINQAPGTQTVPKPAARKGFFRLSRPW